MSSISAYCATLSRDATEPLWGTARHAERWLLIEYQAAWPAKVLKSGLLPNALMRQLDTLQELFPGSHTLFIRQGYTRAGRLRAFLIDCREDASSIQRLEFDDYDELAALDLAAYASGRQHGASEPALYLVCTHGTHDKCCAKFGLPVHAALTAQYGDRVWEASHLGGHRFAANVICFPSGVCYGRVTPEVAPRLIDLDARGELDLSHYRGRFALPPPAQAAEYFLRTSLSLPRLADLRQDRCDQLDSHRWSVSFRAAGTGVAHQVVVELSAEPLQVLKDCEATAPEPVRTFVLADDRRGKA